MQAFRTLRALAACVAFTSLAAGHAQAQETVKIGVLVPITGAHAADGNRLLRAHQLAADQINAAGGIKSLGGAKVELVVADTQSKPEVSRGEAERLISRSKVSSILGAWTSAATIPAMQVAERYRTPFIVTSAVTDAITEKNMKFVFRVSPKSSWAADNVIDFIELLRARNVKIDRIALAFEDGPFGQSATTAYKARLGAKGIAIVAEESFRTGSPDLGTQAAKLKASGADLVLVVAYVDDESVLLRAMASQQYRPLILGYGGGHVHPTLLQLGELAEGTFGVVEWMPDLKKPSTEAFVQAYRDKYNDVPLSNAAQAYAATWVAAQAVNDAGTASDTVKVRDAMKAIRIADGPASLLPNDALAFNDQGQNEVGNVIAQVIDGKFVTVWPDAVAARAPVLRN